VLGLEDSEATAVLESALTLSLRFDALGMVHVHHDGVGAEAVGRLGGVLVVSEEATGFIEIEAAAATRPMVHRDGADVEAHDIARGRGR
jgi:hypothetical protein